MYLKIYNLLILLISLAIFSCGSDKNTQADNFLERWSESNLAYVQQDSAVPEYMEKYIKVRTQGVTGKYPTVRGEFYKRYEEEIEVCMESDSCLIQILELYHEGFTVRDEIFVAFKERESQEFTLYKYNSTSRKEEQVWKEETFQGNINEQLSTPCEDDEAHFDFAILTNFEDDAINSNIQINSCIKPLKFFGIT